jgi:hypothetical protein
VQRVQIDQKTTRKSRTMYVAFSLTFGWALFYVWGGGVNCFNNDGYMNKCQGKPHLTKPSINFKNINCVKLNFSTYTGQECTAKEKKLCYFKNGLYIGH